MVNEFLEDLAALNNILEIHAVFDVIGMRLDVADPAWDPFVFTVFLPRIFDVRPMVHRSIRLSYPDRLLRLHLLKRDSLVGRNR